jgi:hypothetical protein
VVPVVCGRLPVQLGFRVDSACGVAARERAVVCPGGASEGGGLGGRIGRDGAAVCRSGGFECSSS